VDGRIKEEGLMTEKETELAKLAQIQSAALGCIGRCG
jgi:hypothetical protein